MNEQLWFALLTKYYCGLDSSVGIATELRAGRSGIETRWERDFPHLSRPALGPPQPPVKWVSVLSRGKVRPGRAANLWPPSSATVMEE